MNILTSHEFAKALIAAGVIPAATRRLIIDCELDGVVTLYVESYGDDKLMSVDLTQLRGAKVVTGETKP
jgi:hypothetical protein